MNWNWCISNNILMIKNENCELIPSAEEIYYAVFGGVQPEKYAIPLGLGSPVDYLKNIRFSKIAAKPKMHMVIQENIIVGHVFIEKRGIKIPIILPQLGGANHIISDNCWIYFDDDYFHLSALLEESNVCDLKHIPFAGYINVLNNKSNYSGLMIDDFVKDNIEDCTEKLKKENLIGLKANLYHYQEVGYRWLQFITDENCGCILGDEMGLGKTLQVISLLLQRKHVYRGPALVVAPVSLLENWKREIEKFAPELSVVVHNGGHRTGRYKDLLQYDVTVTAYSNTINDYSMLYMINWDLLILDEAQNIKNPNAIRTTSIKNLPHRAGIAVTGTPFENHITDIWSLLDFTMPGCVGSCSEFSQHYADDLFGAEKIEPILSALMIRRRVCDVASDLPDKIVIPQPLAMNNIEAIRYEDERQNILSSCNAKAATLASLTKLRMFCTHPFLLQEDKAMGDPISFSTKYERMCELLDEIVACNEKVLLFTSYSGMFEILLSDIPKRFGIPVSAINGSTPVDERQGIVDTFNQYDGSALLVLNPKAAGVGLNITSANHVIHYNLEWNPALEDQATARAFRRGQKQNVFVYRLYFANTVEQIVNEKIEKKRNISEAAVIGSDGKDDNRSDILAALMKTPLEGE